MKKYFLAVLSLLYLGNLFSDFEIKTNQSFDLVHKLTQDDIDQAKEKLVKQVRYAKYARRSVIGLGVGLAGLLVYKILPVGKKLTVEPYLKANLQYNSAMSMSDLNAELRLQNIEVNQVRLNADNKAIKNSILESRSWSTWFKNTGLSLGVSMAPVACNSIYKKFFVPTDILQHTTHQLGLPASFHQLRVAQTQWDPQAFISHAGHKSESELIAYAHDLVRRFADMPADKIVAIKQEAHKLFVAECSQLVKQVGGVIAYMEYTADLAEYVNIQNMLQDCAASLSLQVNEFVLKIRTQIVAQDFSGLANSVTLFQMSLSTTIKQFANLTNKLNK